MTRKKLVKLAKLEIEQWNPPAKNFALVILFCFIHRLSEGESIEEGMERWSSKGKEKVPDFQI